METLVYGFSRTFPAWLGEDGVAALGRRVLMAATAVVAVLAAAVAYVLYENPCSELSPCRDSRNVAAAEESNLFRFDLHLRVCNCGLAHGDGCG
jgi:peptidoglycan/LPS O-acetylase OafA/YrhL